MIVSCSKEQMNIESDGSLLITEMIEDSVNFTCNVSNLHGSDEITYYLLKGKYETICIERKSH